MRTLTRLSSSHEKTISKAELVGPSHKPAHRLMSDSHRPFAYQHRQRPVVGALISRTITVVAHSTMFCLLHSDSNPGRSTPGAPGLVTASWPLCSQSRRPQVHTAGTRPCHSIVATMLTFTAPTCSQSRRLFRI